MTLKGMPQKHIMVRGEPASLPPARPDSPRPTLIGARPAMTAPNLIPSTVVYKDLADWPGYRVGDDGSVWSCFRRGPGRRFGDWWPRKTFKDQDGYEGVTLRRGGKYHRLKVHRLVLEAFTGPRPAGHEACHNNGIPTDNRLANLRWDTRRGNAADRVVHGTSNEGIRHPAAKLDEAQVQEIREMRAAGNELKSIAVQFGISFQNVSLIANHKAWRHVR
jgi:hypothetical protein